MIEIAGTGGAHGIDMVGIDMSDGNEFKKVTLIPSVAYGITDQLQVMLYHPLNGICLGDDTAPLGGTAPCPKVYNDIGIAAHYYVLNSGKFLLAPHVNVPIWSFDTFVMGVGAGALGQLVLTPKLAVFIDPTILVQANERDPITIFDLILVPVQVGYQITPVLYAYLGTGIFSTFKNFGDNIALPLGVGAMYTIAKKFDIGAEFVLTDLIVDDPVGPADGRALNVRLAFRL